MAKARDAAAGSSGAKSEAATWPQLLAVVLLLGSVLGVLVTGAVLRVDAPASDASRPTARARPPADEPTPAPPAPATAAGLAAVPEDPLQARVARDLERVTGAPERFTAQLAVLCDPERSRRFAADHAGGATSLYLLPTYRGEQACVLVSWGLYPSADAARDAADLPPDLRAISPEPYAKSVAEILEGLR